MKEYLAALVLQASSPLHGRNLTREYLQARILESLQRAGAMIPLAFHGGTALRFLFGYGRYSEDLDFALERAAEGYDFRLYLQKIQADLALEAYSIDLRISDRKTVHSGYVKFPGLFHELGLSPHRDEALGIKLEVDARPPEGARLATTVVRKHVVLRLQHHDQASLLAGKLHAVLQRPFLKGRDLYDLLWYLSDPDWPAPNLVLLNNALQQTGWQGAELTPENWRVVLRQKLGNVEWESASADVRPFLEPGMDASLVSRDNLMAVLDED